VYRSRGLIALDGSWRERLRRWPAGHAGGDGVCVDVQASGVTIGGVKTGRDPRRVMVGRRWLKMWTTAAHAAKTRDPTGARLATTVAVGHRSHFSRRRPGGSGLRVALSCKFCGASGDPVLVCDEVPTRRCAGTAASHVSCRFLLFEKAQNLSGGAAAMGSEFAS
jgi:hypothetical protein